MIGNLIDELVRYGIKSGITDEEDRIYSTNTLLAILGVSDFELEQGGSIPESRSLSSILEDITDYAISSGITEDTSASRDLFDTKLMGALTPPPSVVRAEFAAKMRISPKLATDWYYSFSQATNYIRTDRIARDVRWKADTDYGDIDITINLSKPEKDPRDIARAGQTKSSGYPACLLCKENEGYAGTLCHPARQNHRVIPIRLGGEEYFLQYSPYVYYNEHCIIFNSKHTPMLIDRRTFDKLLDFVCLFPHYTAGSNADLPIVGGSILSHDHFQGGCYEFAMARAPFEKMIVFDGFENVTAGIVRWPLSVIRLQGTDRAEISGLSDKILNAWRGYTDEESFILVETDGIRHNTITPIARRRNGLYEMDLVLRNNITTEECPLGYYHPHPEYHHIKKENIGLIEVMGLAVLPARLKTEMQQLSAAILAGKDIRSIPEIAKHADWAEKFLPGYEVREDNIDSILKKEIGIVFAHVLECSGVYKCTTEGRAGFMRFIESV
ncbi:MAG: UDP-glucose--hexose-1-phosphate uridylyltransferase [Saccharofermentans sp.]|jgi:UDPglucose--hexose-1-phosphate uridylyltransferase|nr:UDP-glucose--hexose-1-phosphate uridylyltransferase [Mageeibacillus sp.]MCI1263996.1 UDP-glucose--hexose-1-phosphate uridylyltransferase [Saccharofermentans sp.]MCI1274558.1 UDP-glucose--hexose-1-phosphate uridylyltransferase [Saccharofermentans sp.]MCI1768941.1 UDP-glucose--hexose-1-phosphate uridylyltransferase [Mageeibacillus sp.]MCI2043844.1 UDP-glucose--hexose-1-phosphate uridylyltransferase [Mageeibacillus sp.]